ncbi:hypothetical protein N752_04435 [Desulforamulus aquiferis]|nr:hypothetical protein N752_04435 [Desulforamulus aquiferis]
MIKADEILGIRLTTIHNLHFIQQLMENIKDAIRQDRLLQYRQEFLQHFNLG